MLHAVIMAGGAGTRFWPASRVSRPKQLLHLLGERTMIQATVDRLGRAIPPERVMIVTADRLAGEIARQLPELPAGAIVGEPCKRDTAPCIGLAALLIRRSDADAVMAVMPADHVIETGEQFRRAIVAAARLVDEAPGRIVTFGIRPTYPAETFGYIQRGRPHAPEGGVFHVEQFREKPDAAAAQQFVESGEYYWNSGIFLWKAQTILDALAAHQPKMFSHLERIAEAAGTPEFDAVLSREFPEIEGISIDYAVMEHASGVLVVEAPFDWDDLGNWQSLARLRVSDDAGNTAVGRHLGIDTRNCIVRSDADHLVVTVGLDDLIVVHTPDATLVADRNSEESIRQVVEILKERGWDTYR